MIHLEKILNSKILNKDIVAYHGTSINALNEILEDGRFYSVTCFFVVKSRWYKLLPKNEIEKFDKFLYEEHLVTLIGAYSLAKAFARSKAFFDFLYYDGRLSGVLDTYDEHHNNMFPRNGLLDEVCERNLIEIGKKLGHDPKEVQETICLGLRRKGAIIGIHRDFFSDKTLEDFYFDGFGFNIKYPKDRREERGIETEFIDSIYIRTEEERKKIHTNHLVS